MDGYMLNCLSVLTSLCLLAFTFMLALDVRSAFQKRASWIPGKVLLLGALTIQLLAFVAGTNISLLRDSEEEVGRENLGEWLTNQLVLSACELNVCVFLGYFITHMVYPRSLDSLAAILALVLGLYFPLKNFVSRNAIHDKNGFSLFRDYFGFHWILFVVSAFLILLLGCTVIAGIAIRHALKQNISAILSSNAKDEEVHELSMTENDERMSSSWNDFEDELFKSWIVARVSQPDYVIARSVLSSAAGVVVTFCVFICMWVYAEDSRYTAIFYMPVSPLFFPLCVYVLEEWVVICCRWHSSLLIRKRFFCFEDFWTRALREKIDMYDLHNWRTTSNYSFEMSLTKIATIVRLHKTLHLIWILQILVVLVCKFFWVLSEVLFGKIARQCHKHYIAWCSRRRIQPSLYSRHRSYESYAALLERICMPGENPSDLWQANKSAIDRIDHVLKDGHYNGRTISNILFTPFSMEWVDQGFQLLLKLQNEALPQLVNFFPNSEKPCWKMTVVSLTLLIIRLHKPVKSDRVTNAFKAGNQVWDLLSFVDGFDRDVDEESMAADKELSRLRQLYESLPFCSEQSAHEEITMKMAKDLCRNEIKSVQDEVNGDTQNTRWRRIARNYNFCKLCKVMETELDREMMEDLEEQRPEADTAEDLISWAESSLRNVIAAGVYMVPDLLAKHCWKCALGFEEDKIWEAIYLAGKARGIIDSWGLELKWTSNEYKLQLNQGSGNHENCKPPCLC